jgi:gamma-glutamylcyclotransferase (GGCT)/AIG2-like uncharacterized protein YtfP
MHLNAADSPLLRIFVYGTLKRGYHNHVRYCRGAASAEAASTPGRLYLLPQDAVTQRRVAAEWKATASNWSETPAGDWEQITGEVLTFNDPAARLPPLDALEDFHPDGASLYRRALVPIRVGTIEPIWTYVAPDGQPPAEARRIGPVWPE